jgi:hypothetical protein
MSSKHFKIHNPTMLNTLQEMHYVWKNTRESVLTVAFPVLRLTAAAFRGCAVSTVISMSIILKRRRKHSNLNVKFNTFFVSIFLATRTHWKMKNR